MKYDVFYNKYTLYLAKKKYIYFYSKHILCTRMCIFYDLVISCIDEDSHSKEYTFKSVYHILTFYLKFVCMFSII